jgi:hypothetical protein
MPPVNQQLITDYLQGTVSLEDASAQISEALRSGPSADQADLEKLTALGEAVSPATTWPCVITMIFCS